MVAETNDTITISVRVPVQLRKRFEALAQATGRTKNYLMTEALVEYLDHEEWQIAEIEEAIREADEHPEQMVKHEDVVADLLARGIVTQDGLDRAEREVSLEELRRAQQTSAWT
jgi:RHH-type rel operon transcriptional repressor/antitoxin RelB